VLPQDWFANYIAAYVERDVRQLIAVKDVGQLSNLRPKRVQLERVNF
jgi:hypothetical protein